MAESNEDLKQNIDINFKTNAQEAANSVDSLGNAVVRVTEEMPKSVDANEEVTKSTKNFKTQLREANQELLKASQLYGESSKEAVNAAKKVAELKDQMGFAKDLVDKFNPDQKFKALGAATQVAATGMQGLTAGTALFGDQSEDTEKALLKVQSAMAFSDAISNLSNLGDQFKLLKTTFLTTFSSLLTAKTADSVATGVNTTAQTLNATATGASNASRQTAVVSWVKDTAATISNTVAKGASIVATNAVTAAQWLWNSAILANPLVALVVAIVAAGAAIYKLTTFLIDSSKANDDASKATAKATREFEKQKKASAGSSEALKENNSQLYALAVASGKSSEELRKLRTKHAEEEVALNKKNAELARSTFLRQRDTLEMLRNSGASDEVIANQEKLTKATYEELKKQNDNLKDSYKNRRSVSNDNQVEIVKEQTDARNKEIERQKEHAKKLADERRKAADDEKAKRKALLDSLKNLEENYLNSIEDLKDKSDNDKLARQKERDLEVINNLKKQGVDVSELLKLNNEKYTILEKELADKQELARKELEQKRIDDKHAFDEQYYTGLKEFADAKNPEEIETVRKHKEELLEVEKEFALRKIEEDGGTPEELKEKEEQLNEYYRQKKNENDKLADDANLAQKQVIKDQLKSLQEQGFATAKMLFEKNKNVQKGILITENAIALANIGINTAKGISKAMAKGPILGIPEAAIVGASGALSAASVIAATAKGMKALGGGSSGDSGGTTQAVPSGGATPQVGFQNSSENQIANSVTNSQQATPPIQAFVVSQEVTNAQQIDRNRIISNSF